MSSNPSNNSPESDRLSFREKLCYGLGDVSNGLAVSSIGFWLLIYLTDVAGLGAFFAGVAIMIGRVWDAVTDPVMGWITDHTKTRWGKRRPYLLFGAIPYAVAFFALWTVPEFESEIGVFAYVTVTLLIFNTCLTVIFVPYTSLTAAITNDYDERTSLTAFRMTSSQIAFLFGAAVPSAFVLWITSQRGIEFFHSSGLDAFFGSWVGSPRAAYLLMGAMFAVLMVASIWITFFGTRERDVDAPAAVQDTTPFDYASSILDELQGNRPFRISVVILLLTNCAITFVAVNLPYYLRYVVDLRADQTKIISVLFVTAIFAVPIWVPIAKRFGKAESFRVAMVLYTLALCLLPMIGSGQLLFAYIAAACCGFFHAAALMLPWAMVPDVVEFDELKTGKRREGLFYGGTTFSYKLASATAIFFSGWALESVGYVPNEEQTMQVMLGIKGLIAAAPSILLLLAAYLSIRYPLSSERHKKIRDELELRRVALEDG